MDLECTGRGHGARADDVHCGLCKCPRCARDGHRLLAYACTEECGTTTLYATIGERR